MKGRASLSFPAVWCEERERKGFLLPFLRLKIDFKEDLPRLPKLNNLLGCRGVGIKVCWEGFTGRVFRSTCGVMSLTDVVLVGSGAVIDSFVSVSSSNPNASHANGEKIR